MGDETLVLDDVVPGGQVAILARRPGESWTDSVEVCLEDPATGVSEPVAPTHLQGRKISIPIPSSAVSPRLRVTDMGFGSLHVRSRRLHLSGTTNFRDVGGYRTGRGFVKWDSVYRSDNLAKLDLADWTAIKNLGIARILDLRNDDEVAESPTIKPPGFDHFEIERLKMTGEVRGTTEALELVLDAKIDQITVEDMCGMYIKLLENHLDGFLTGLEYLEAEAGPATLVHCTAGKDRTGILVAFYLLRQGVAIEDVLYDYIRSNLLRTPARVAVLTPRFVEAGVDIARFLPYLSAPPMTLFAAIDWARRERPELIRAKQR